MGPERRTWRPNFQFPRVPGSAPGPVPESAPCHPGPLPYTPRCRPRAAGQEDGDPQENEYQGIANGQRLRVPFVCPSLLSGQRYVSVFCPAPSLGLRKGICHLFPGNPVPADATTSLRGLAGLPIRRASSPLHSAGSRVKISVSFALLGPPPVTTCRVNLGAAASCSYCAVL